MENKRILHILAIAGFITLIFSLITCRNTPKELVSISVTALPKKTTYALNEKFNAAGLEVTGVYSDGSKGKITGFTYSGFNSKKLGKKTIKVQYKGLETKFEVMIQLFPMVKIPAGTFTMGSPVSEPGRENSGLPNNGREEQHQVTLSAFYIGIYQVTQEQYEYVMEINPSWFHGGAGREPADGEEQEKRPVEGVNWYDTLVFANTLSKLEGLSPAYKIKNSTNPDDWGTVPTKGHDFEWDAVEVVPGSTGYRLPTEAQWEYACRAGETAAFNNGTNDYRFYDELKELGWMGIPIDENWTYDKRTHQAGLKMPNKWGIYDMHGNVMEWCWDRFSNLTNQPQTDPTGPATGDFFRLMRGGSYYFAPHFARSADRNNRPPYERLDHQFLYFEDPEHQEGAVYQDFSHYGFRLARP